MKARLAILAVLLLGMTSSVIAKSEIKIENKPFGDTTAVEVATFLKGSMLNDVYSRSIIEIMQSEGVTRITIDKDGYVKINYDIFTKTSAQRRVTVNISNVKKVVFILITHYVKEKKIEEKIVRFISSRQTVDIDNTGTIRCF